MDLSALSTEDLLALKSGDLSKVSTDGLVKMKSSISEQTEPKGGNISRFVQGIGEGVGQAGVGMMQAAGELIAPTPMFGMQPATGTLSSVAQPAKDLLTQTVDSSKQRVDQMGTSGALGSLTGNLVGGAPATLLAGPTMGAEELAALTARGVSQPVLNSAGKIVGPVARAVGTIAKNAVQGGVAGAQQPVGENDSRLDNAALGTVAGGVIGAAKPVLQTAKGTLDVGKRVLTGRDADAVLSDIISRSSDTPENLLGKLKSGQISGIADIAGDDVQGLTRSVAKQPMAKNIISDALEGRSMGAVQRVANHLSKDVSSVDAYYGSLDDISKARAKVAAPLYKQAFDSNPTIVSKDVDAVLATPAGKSALTQAANKMQNDMATMGVRDPALEAQAKAVGQAAQDGIARGLNLRSLDYVKRALDDQISTAHRAGENDNARILTGLKNNLLTSLDAADKTGSYSLARTTFAGFSKMSEAQQAGLDFSKHTPEELGMMLKDMSAGEKDAFRIGVRENLQRTVNKTGDGNDPARRIFGNTQQRQQLEQVFGGSKKFQDFSDKMTEEINGARTKQRVLGGSRTDFNIDADSNFGELVDKISKQGLKQGFISHYAEKAFAIVKNRYLGINDDNAKAIAHALVDRKSGIAALERMTKQTGTPDAKAAQEAIDAIQRSGSTLRNAPDPRSKPLRIDMRKDRTGR